VTRNKTTKPGGADAVAVTLTERSRVHGEFTAESVTTEATRDAWRAAPNWAKLAPYQKVALDMIALKVARILHGDHDYFDHWRDVAGYARLVDERCPGGK
jgi:hypothetical protein